VFEVGGVLIDRVFEGLLGYSFSFFWVFFEILKLGLSTSIPATPLNPLPTQIGSNFLPLPRIPQNGGDLES